MSIINFYAFQGIQDEQKAVEKFLEKIPQVNQKVTLKDLTFSGGIGITIKETWEFVLDYKFTTEWCWNSKLVCGWSEHIQDTNTLSMDGICGDLLDAVWSPGLGGKRAK